MRRGVPPPSEMKFPPEMKFPQNARRRLAV
jgi:hypothetical protein